MRQWLITLGDMQANNIRPSSVGSGSTRAGSDDELTRLRADLAEECTGRLVAEAVATIDNRRSTRSERR